MRSRSCQALILASTLLLLALPALGQADLPGLAGTPLAGGRLASVVGMPLFFRLYRAHLPAAQQTHYDGSSAIVYDLSGAATMGSEGVPMQPLAAGAGALIAAGQPVTIRASDSEPVELLVFLLTARPNQGRPLLGRPAVIRELFRTPDPLPGLQEGPYEFSLARLTLPAGAASAAYARSGAALDFVLAGTAALTADGKTETMPPETALFERFGWVHSLANPGTAPLVLLQANLSQEGVPAVRPAPEK